MAKTQRDLTGWQFSLAGASAVSGDQAGEGSSPVRRSSRRTRESSSVDQSLILKRESDGLEVKKGSILVVRQGGSKGGSGSDEDSEIALVKEVNFGNLNFIDIVVLWFIAIKDVDQSKLPPGSYGVLNERELFATEYKDEIRVDEIIGEAKVVSQAQYDDAQKVVEAGSADGAAEADKAASYVCRRGCDINGERFSTEFDFSALYGQFMADSSSYVDFLREETIPAAYKRAKVAPKTAGQQRAKKKAVRKVSQEEDDEDHSDSGADENDSEDSANDVNLDTELSDSDDELSDDFSDDDEYSSSSRKRKRGNGRASPRKTTSVSGSPRKARTPSKASASARARGSAAGESADGSSPTKRRGGRSTASPGASPTKLQLTDRKVINSMLSPLKKRLRLKGDLAKPSLSSSPTRPVQARQLTVKRGSGAAHIDLNDGPLSVDATSEVFKELKAKLHTSMKLTSLPCREDEFTSIYLNLETAIQEQTGCCLYVSGTPGVGKTATIREVIAQLKDLIPTQEIQDFDYVEINGLKLLTPQVAYEILWEKVSGLSVSSSNAALLLESYFKIEEEDEKRKPLVVLMDELDQIVTKKQNVMYNFFNWPTYRYSKLIVIAVANTMDLPERVLSNKISSRLGLRRIQFIGYTYEQLGVIIKHRLDMISKLNSKSGRKGGKKVIVNEDAVSFASRKVASVSGDARRALTICRRAVEIAEADYKQQQQQQKQGANATSNGGEGAPDGDEDSFHVSITHISRAINETINSPIAQFLSSLPFAHKLALVGVLLRIRRSGLAENSLGDILDEMKNSLVLLVSKTLIKDEVDRVQLLYGSGLIAQADANENSSMNIRILKFKHVINELVENGILLQQNIKGERHKLIHLNISEEEIVTVLKRDKEVNGML